MRTSESRPLLEIPRDIHHRMRLFPLRATVSLVMSRVVSAGSSVPVMLNQFRNDGDDAPGRVLTRKRKHVIDNRIYNEPAGRSAVRLRTK